ncbi:MAG TPA: GNAT family N-acetyltransferase [Chryseolinea sp.]|nr:GNAT family N-acetyltransferase [Chryseolinea sp.]
MDNHKLIVRLATADDKHYAETVTREMEESAKARGTGIAKRSPEYIAKKIDEGKAVIAVTEDGTWVGFCYIEAWEHGKYVANSGLIVAPAFRKTGVATEIKRKIFSLSREKYPTSKIFGLTTGLAVMKINSDLGYEPVTYSELTSDEEFWKGCKSCINYEILTSKDRKNCMCTAMLFDPAEAEAKLREVEAARAAKALHEPEKTETLVTPQGDLVQHRHRQFKGNLTLFERWVRFKQFVLLKSPKKRDEGDGDESTRKRSLLSIFFW